MLFFVCFFALVFVKRANRSTDFFFSPALLSLCTAKHTYWVVWLNDASAELSIVSVCVCVCGVCDLRPSPCLSFHKGVGAVKLCSSTSLNEIDRMWRCHPHSIFSTGEHWDPPPPPPPPQYPWISLPLIQSSRVDSVWTATSASSWWWSCRYMVLSIQLFVLLDHRRKTRGWLKHMGLWREPVIK